MAAPGRPAAARPEVIKAIPIRHWGRRLSAAIVLYLAAALIVSFIKSPNVDWPTVFEYMFKPLTLRALALTVE
jgi:polar amino acid transport system permease protein